MTRLKAPLLKGGFIRKASPYSEEVCEFNSKGLLINHFLDDQIMEYDYDDADQLISFGIEDGPSLVEYDQNGNLTKKYLERQVVILNMINMEDYLK